MVSAARLCDLGGVRVPANLSPEYRIAEEQYRQAHSTDDKLAALNEMLRAIPKHKGTEKMQADIKRRLARLREEKKQPRKSGGVRQKPVYLVERQGAGRVCLLGAPSTGKSQLLRALTNAQPEVAEYPFTTTLPQPGMLIHDNVQVQLLDLPPLHPDMSPPWLQEVIKGADALILLADLANDALLTDMELVTAMLGRMGVTPVPGVGLQADAPDLILPPGLEVGPSHDADDPQDLFDADGNLRGRPQPALLVATKLDAPDAEVRLEMLLQLHNSLPVLPVSAVTGQGMEQLRRLAWGILGMIRIYTRAPGKSPDLTAPFTLDAGSTVLEAAAAVHKELAERFRYARAWGANTFEGQRVSGSHVLADGDIIEIHSS